jgi:hypothetical protein
MLDPIDTDLSQDRPRELDISTGSGAIRFGLAERGFFDVRNRYLHRFVLQTENGRQV